MRVLVAEDESVTRLVLKKTLAKWGYDVTCVSDGDQAWEILQRPDAPRLAILDWMMPGLDGTTVCERVRRQNQEPYIYVLLLSGKGEKQAIVDGLAAGADDYVTKPFDHSELEVRLRSGARIAKLQQDIVASQRAAEEQAAQLTAVFDSAALGIVRFDTSGRMVDTNSQFRRMLGYDAAELEARGLDCMDRNDAAMVAVAHERILAGSEHNADLECRYVHSNGSIRWATVNISAARTADRALINIVHLVRDTTERRNLEMSLRLAQKLQSVGRLAAGVAHEINTPIQFVGDSIEFANTAVTDLIGLIDRYREIAARHGDNTAASHEEAVDLAYLVVNGPAALARAQDGVHRVATIVRSMKTFAHPDSVEMESVDLNHGIESTLIIARNEYRQVADVDTQLGDIPLVTGYGGELNQVFLNLIVNAAHAIHDNVGGTSRRGRIEVRTYQDGDHVVVAISDTGGGIPETVQAQIFDPFFTTKEVGRGTGQGLAIARSVIVDKHHGDISFTTKVGEGTTFFIRLPIEPANAAPHDQRTQLG